MYRPIRRVPVPGRVDVIALTEREREVAQCVAEGMSNRQIGEWLGITASGAKFHVDNLKAKFGCGSRTVVAVTVTRLGLAVFPPLDTALATG